MGEELRSLHIYLLLGITDPVVVMIDLYNFGYLYMRVFPTIFMKVLTILSSDEY